MQIMAFQIIVNLRLLVQFEELAANLDGDDFRVRQLRSKACGAKFTAFFNLLHNPDYQTINRK